MPHLGHIGCEKFMGETYEEFASVFYIRRDYQQANKIWNDRRNHYVHRATEIASFIKENQWITVNPGRQHFGKLNPVIANPREWYGPDYKPVIVGISMDRFQALADCYKNVAHFDKLPHEIFKLICHWWFVAEAKMARVRLFNLVRDETLPFIDIPQSQFVMPGGVLPVFDGIQLPPIGFPQEYIPGMGPPPIQALQIPGMRPSRQRSPRMHPEADGRMKHYSSEESNSEEIEYQEHDTVDDSYDN